METNLAPFGHGMFFVPHFVMFVINDCFLDKYAQIQIFKFINLVILKLYFENSNCLDFDTTSHSEVNLNSVVAQPAQKFAFLLDTYGYKLVNTLSVAIEANRQVC